MRVVKLLYISLGDLFLLVIGIKNCRAILRPAIRALAIQFRGVMRYREEDLQQLPVGNLAGIVSYLNRFGMAGLSRAYGLIMGCLRFASAETGNRVCDAF